ncbi:MAG: hypothetical protein ACRDRK_00155 [Pseudonocardia sp.]
MERTTALTGTATGSPAPDMDRPGRMIGATRSSSGRPTWPPPTGGIVHLRPILPGDAAALVQFPERLSERTRYLRFFGSYPHIPRAISSGSPPCAGGVRLPAG